MSEEKENILNATEPEKKSEESKDSFSFDSLKPKIKPIWKVLFAVLLLACIGASLYFSFNAVSFDMYEYEETDGGYKLVGYHSDKSTNVLYFDSVYEKKGNEWVANPEKKVTAIGKYAVCCDEYITEIHIGASVTSIEEQAFYYSKSLQVIFVDENNPCYRSENGILYNKDKTEVILFPMQYVQYEGNTLKTQEGEQTVMRYTLPTTVKRIVPLCFAYAENLVEVVLPSVEEIGSMAFFKCASMEKITLSDNTRIIASDAFSYCKKLTEMFLPKAVEKIEHHAFFECVKLSSLQVERTESEFKRVQKGDYWNNISLTETIKIEYGKSR